jgi:hypothetical protein
MLSLETPLKKEGNRKKRTVSLKEVLRYLTLCAELGKG